MGCATILPLHLLGRCQARSHWCYLKMDQHAQWFESEIVCSGGLILPQPYLYNGKRLKGSGVLNISSRGSCFGELTPRPTLFAILCPLRAFALQPSSSSSISGGWMAMSKEAQKADRILQKETKRTKSEQMRSLFVSFVIFCEN